MGPLLASVVLPAVVDMAKGLVGSASRRFVGLSVDDQLKLQDAEVRKLEAVSKLDNPHGTPSQWVIDLRAAFRYVAAALVIVIGAGIAVFGIVKNHQVIIVMGLDMAGMPFGFIFGERMWNGFKGTINK